MFKNKVVKNAAWIIACKIVQSVFSIVVTMLTARFLGPSGYGIINYAASIVAFVAPIMMLGLNSTLVQEFVQEPDKEGESLGTALLMSFSSSFLCILGVIAFTLIANPGEKTTTLVCGLYSLLLIFQALELTQYWFQAKLKSKYTSIVMLIAYVIVSVYKIVLLVTGSSIYFFAISQALDFMIIAFALLIIYKKIGGPKLSFSRACAKRMLQRSKHYILSNLMINLVVHTDKVMLKLMLSDEATGWYSAATACCLLTNFVFTAIIDSARPSVLENKKNNEAAFEKSVSRLYSVILYLALLQSVFVCIFAPLIVKILYGSEYAASVNALRLAVWYTPFAYIGSVRNIWILAEGKQKYLWLLNLSGAVVNVVLNFLLIPEWGVMGAALASLITQVFSNYLLNYLIPPLRRNNTLLVKGLNPKLLTEMLKRM